MDLVELSASPRKIRKNSGKMSEGLSEILDNGENARTDNTPDRLSTKKRYFREYDEFIDQLTQKSLVDNFKFSKLTDIQDKAVRVNMDKDILGRAPTGTGKTIAFLIPTLETILHRRDRPGVNIGAIILSPTRELAIQIGAEADEILYHHTNFSCQVMVGGTSIHRDRALLAQRIPTLLISTPGRFLEHIESSKRVTNGKKFTDIISRIHVLVLDEADRLLEQGGSGSDAIGGGFRKDILRIISYLPKRRRTLMFSATLPPTTSKRNEMVADLMRDNYHTIDCLSDKNLSLLEEKVSPMQQKERISANMIIPIEQKYLVLTNDMTKHLVEVLRVIYFATIERDRATKIIVFFPTARMVSFYANVFELVYCKSRDNLEVLQIHSKKSQGYRSRVSSAFRGEDSTNDDKTTKILFTTDVSARGMDYPMVSHVIQFGVASGGHKGYTHRLGRTGRLSQQIPDYLKGQNCQGWLILMDFERTYLDSLLRSSNTDISDIKPHSKLQNYINLPSLPSVNMDDGALIDQLFMRIRSGDKTFTPLAQHSYQSFLAYYTSRGILKYLTFNNVANATQHANDYAVEGLGLKEVPVLDAVVVKKMGLENVSGIRTA